MSELKLTGTYVWRQVCALGYLPLESFLSTQDIVDEAILCIDPDFPDDMELGRRICDKFQKARMVEFRWPSNVPGDGSRIGVASQFALNQASGTHCLNVQADEVWPTPLMEWVRDYWREVVKSGVECLGFKVLNLEHNAQRFQGGEEWDGIKFNPDGTMSDAWNRGGMFNGRVGGAGYNKATKLFRRCPGIRFARDAWSVEGCAVGWHTPISDEYPILHMHDNFRDSLIALRKNASDNIWTDREKFGHYKASSDAIESSRNDWIGDLMWISTHSPFENMMPEYVKNLIGKTEYSVRWSLIA